MFLFTGGLQHALTLRLVQSLSRPARVLVADDQPLFRDALARAIRDDPALELVGVAACPGETRTAVARHRPDVIVADERLVDAVLADRLRDDGHVPRLLVLASRPGPANVYVAMEGGANGCMSKEASANALRSAILATAEGRTLLDIAAQDDLARAIRLRGRDQRPVLSPREREILGLIAQGRTAPEIARQLRVGRTTVKTHMLHLYDKLGVTERAAAVAEAMRRGLLE